MEEEKLNEMKKKRMNECGKKSMGKNSQHTDDRLIRVYVRESNENDEDIN